MNDLLWTMFAVATLTAIALGLQVGPKVVFLIRQSFRADDGEYGAEEGSREPMNH